MKQIPETIQAIKERNARYYWMSKWFIEAVNYGNTYNKTLYCGMNMLLNISSTNIRLRGPTSTSNEICVAMNFATRHGIILEFKNLEG